MSLFSGISLNDNTIARNEGQYWDVKIWDENGNLVETDEPTYSFQVFTNNEDQAEIMSIDYLRSIINPQLFNPNQLTVLVTDYQDYPDYQ